jgi:hypothetical protein
MIYKKITILIDLKRCNSVGNLKAKEVGYGSVHIGIVDEMCSWKYMKKRGV